MKIAFFDAKSYDRPAFEKYAAQNDVKIKFYDTKLTEDTVDLAKGCEAVCVFVNDNVNKNIVDSLYELGVKVIALRCAGYNNVDLKACFGKIHVVRVPAYSPYAVAEHAAALLLTSIRRIHKAYIRTRNFNFSLEDLTGFDLHGKTVGVIGTGKIGTIFINICRGFGMNVLCYDMFPREIEGATNVGLDELFEKSDIISLHCPLTDGTRHLINAETIEKMKKGVVIINTSRGALIDSEALLNGLKARKIGAACLDVYEEEASIFFKDFSSHIVNDDLLTRLIAMPNVILTSHQAFLTEEALSNIAETTINNVLSYGGEGKLLNEVCYECDKVGTCKRDVKNKCF